MSDAPTSTELFAASKIIGRECSSINKAFWECKRDLGNDPKACEEHTKLVMACTKNT